MTISSQVYYYKKLGKEDPSYIEGRPMNEVKILVSQTDGKTTEIVGVPDKNGDRDNTEASEALALALQSFVGKDRKKIDEELQARGFHQTI